MTTAAAPKNHRLNNRDRSALYAFAKRQITETQDKTELDAAYERAADAIHAAVIAKAPQKDMAVLAKYGFAERDTCIYISTGGYNYDQFTYRDGDKRVVLRPHANCSRQSILLEGDADKAYDEFKAAEKRFDAAVKARLNDFNALIYGTPSFNALVEVWPAAEAMREKIVGTSTALAVLSSEVVDRIKADPALTMAEAA